MDLPWSLHWKYFQIDVHLLNKMNNISLNK